MDDPKAWSVYHVHDEYAPGACMLPHHFMAFFPSQLLHAITPAQRSSTRSVDIDSTDVGLLPDMVSLNPKPLKP